MAVAGVPRGVMVDGGLMRPPTKARAENLRARSPLWQIKNAQSDEGVVQNTRDLFQLAVRSREPYSRRWPEYYDWARGNQWPHQRAGWRSKVIANYLYANLRSKTALLTDSRPKVRAVPRTPKTTQLVEGWINPWLDWVWEYDRMDELYAEAMFGMFTFGTYFMMPYWDPTQLGGRGMIVTEIEDPAFIWPDPGATRVNDGEFFFHAKPMSLEQIERLFPDRGRIVQPEEIEPDFFSARDRSAMFGGTHIPVDRKISILGRVVDRLTGKQGRAVDPGYDIPRAFVVSLFMRQNEGMTIETPDGEKREVEFPHGRHIVMANGVLLEDQAFELPFIPLIRYTANRWANEFWGMSEMEQGIPLQREMNTQRANVAEHMHWFGHGQTVMDEGAVRHDLLTNNPAQVIEKKPGREYRRDQPVPLPISTIRWIDQLQFDFENVLQNQDVTQGRDPFGIRSGKALEIVQEAATSGMRLTERLVAEGIEDWGRMAIAIARENMDEDLIFRVAQEAGGREQWRKIRPKDFANEFDFVAAVGSQTSRGRQRFTVTDLAVLFNLGIIDDQAVLELSDTPGARAIMERVARLRQMQQQQNPQLNQEQPVPNQGGAAALSLVQGGR